MQQSLYCITYRHVVENNAKMLNIINNHNVQKNNNKLEIY